METLLLLLSTVGGVTADSQSKELNGLVHEAVSGGLNIVEPLYETSAVPAAASDTADFVEMVDNDADDGFDADTDWLWEYNISIVG